MLHNLLSALPMACVFLLSNPNVGLTSGLGYKGDIFSSCVLYSTLYCIEFALTLPCQNHTSNTDTNFALVLLSQKHTSTAVNMLPSTAVNNDAGNKQRHLNWAMLQQIVIGKAHQCICISCSTASKQSHDTHEVSLK
jgi:hypothetical protein